MLHTAEQIQNYTTAQAVTALTEIVRDGLLLKGRDLLFAADLLKAAATVRGMSSNQDAWVRKLIIRALYPEQRPVQGEVVNVAPIFALLAKAQGAGLKYPKIRLHTAEGRLVVLALAGAKSKYAGQVMLTDGGPFGSNVWYGAIAQDGTWQRSRAVTPDVVELLRSLSADPAQVARAFGRATGSCCFCGRELETAESVTVGYGPVCAANFGLPWGEVVESTTVIVEAA